MFPRSIGQSPTGADASLVLEVVFPGGGDVDVKSFVLQADDARFEGSAELDASPGALKKIDITRLLFGETDATARIVPSGGPAEPLRVSIGGESWDLRPYLKNIMEKGEGPVPDLELEFDVKRLITRIDQQITDAHARARFKDQGLQTAFIEGTLTTGAPFRLRLEPEGERRRLIVESDDAGAVARAFDLYDNAIGGKLLLEAMILGDLETAPVEGFVQIDNFHVRDAPTLADLLAFASITGIGDVLSGEGIAFDQFYMPFTLFNDVVTIKDARTAGSALGITGGGTVNLTTDDTNINGTIVPVYVVNSALGSLPLIGDLFTGGVEGGGLFAATYTVRGPLEAPTLTVNPLAALAPSFLRDLFTIFDGDVTGEESGTTAETPQESDR